MHITYICKSVSHASICYRLPKNLTPWRVSNSCLLFLRWLQATVPRSQGILKSKFQIHKGLGGMAQ
jgi:hypothetical protein